MIENCKEDFERFKEVLEFFLKEYEENDSSLRKGGYPPFSNCELSIISSLSKGGKEPPLLRQ